MNHTFRQLLLCCAIFTIGALHSQNRNQAYLMYINQYWELAQKQQKEYGIPASITLAQGLLESGAGQSTLAKTSNNHFGIKCAEWKGDKTYYDDDEKGECFRKYNHVLESYEDHSLFLKNRNRYSFLFELKPTDYEGWAYGLKKAGYATDPTYAFKLISIIDNYELHKYDTGKSGHTYTYKRNSTGGSYSGGSIGSVAAYVTHKVIKINRIKCVVALPGDNYTNIADEFNMSETRLRKYNEVAANEDIEPGTVVFLGKKKNKAAKDLERHIVRIGETMYSIAHKYGIKTIKLYELNQMDGTKGPVLGSVLKLR